MREERVAGGRAGLHSRAHEVLVEIQQRREVRRQEGRADRVRPGCGLEANAHRRAAAAAEEGLRSGLTAAADWPGGPPRATTTVAAIGRLVASAALPVDQRELFAVEQHREPFAGHRSEAGRRHVVAEDRRHGQRVFAVGREHVRHEHAATRAERHALDVIVLRRVLARAIHDQRRLFRIAHCQAADLLCRGDVRLDERRRQPECASDVVKAGRRVVRRQVLAGIDLQIEQVAHDVRVLGAVEAMQSWRRRERRGRAIEGVLERSDHRLEPIGVGTLHAERRHLSRARLAHDQFPLLAILVDVGRIERVHRQTTRRVETRGLHLLAVAADAVLVEKRALIVGRDRGYRRRCHGDRLRLCRTGRCSGGFGLTRLRRGRLRPSGLGVKRARVHRCRQATHHQRSSCHRVAPRTRAGRELGAPQQDPKSLWTK